METRIPIVVLTPIKNEAWILDRFLKVSSEFADLIILLDQQSTDSSLEIAANYPKVRVYNNDTEEFNEAGRQLQLIRLARELVPGPKILLALDADEILAANAPYTAGWSVMLNSKPGTILYFEKPTFLYSTEKVIRYRESFPLGYVDDGAEHKPTYIHSCRLPIPPYGKHLHFHDIKILHYGLVRLSAQKSKMRMYCVLENIKNNRSLFVRRKFYSSGKKFEHTGYQFENTPYEWFEAWEKKGIDMQTILESKYYWYDYEVLRLFEKYGTDRFWMDDIWDFDWEKCRRIALEQQIEGIPQKAIRKPGKAVKVGMRLFDKATNIGRKLVYG